MRRFIFRLIFTKPEQVAIVNALYHRRDEPNNPILGKDQHIRDRCNNLANELL